MRMHTVCVKNATEEQCLVLLNIVTGWLSKNICTACNKAQLPWYYNKFMEPNRNRYACSRIEPAKEMVITQSIKGVTNIVTQADNQSINYNKQEVSIESERGEDTGQ